LVSIWLQYLIVPKKSKKQKILSSLRNQARVFHVENTGELNKEKNVESRTGPSRLVFLQEDASTSTYFKKDLTKSLLLILATIALEIFIYFVSMSTDLSKILKF